MANMTGDLKTALKDLQADIISVKHDAQACIMDASMRKAILTESEKDVKDDVRQIRVKLEAMLKAIETRAIMALNGLLKNAREDVNSEIVALEEEHKSMEDLEQFIKSKTSNISAKPLQEGREKCDLTKESLERYRNNAERKGAQFLLHPLLTLILEQIESFTMGEIILRPKMDEITEQADEVPQLSSEKTNASMDPSKTSFMRSNSSKLIRLNSKDLKQNNVSQQNSTKSGNRQQANKTLSRQTSQHNNQSAGSRQKSQNNNQSAGSRRNSVNSDRSGVGGQNSVQTSRDGNSKSTTVPQLTETKPLQRTLTLENIKNVQLKRKPSSVAAKSEDDYRNIAGLKATITKRSVTAPIINLVSPVKSTFAPISEELPSPVIRHKETIETLKHDKNCYITGVAVMTNGSVVICDNVHDSLQLYNPQNQHISELECLHPWAVTPVSQSAVAVTLHYDHKVILIKTDDKLERLNEKDIVLKCKSSLCFDIKFYSFRLYVLCVNSDIHVVDLKGREYSVIRTGISPNTLKYIDVDTDSERVLVSGEHGIACLDYRGLPLWKYKSQSKGKICPMGILALKGRVIFCDWENHCLKELYEDGHKIRTVFSETIEKPVAIAASADGETVVFSQGDYDMDVDKSRVVRILEVEPVEVSP